MGITEDILVRCKQLLEESSVLLKTDKIITIDEIQVRRHAASIAGEASFILLQKAFITPFDREDIWSLRQACESVWETAQEIALARNKFSKGALFCEETAHILEQLGTTLTIPVPALFSVEYHLNTMSIDSYYQDFVYCGKQVMFCLQRLLLKSN